MARFESQFFDYLNSVIRYLKAQPLNLGGSTYSGGGLGGPPGGFIGMLPQTRVAYDLTEAATLETTGSGSNWSGASLVDNLNHIRFRLDDLEDTIYGGITILDSDVVVASGITVVNFENVEIEYVAPDRVNITLSLEQNDKFIPSGVFGESLSPQIGASGGTHFFVNKEIYDNSLRVFLNGVRQAQSFHTLDTSHYGFTTTYTVISGDELEVDYDVLVNEIAFVHTSGVSLAYLEENYYNKTEVDGFLVNKSNVGHTHTESEITDLSHDAELIQGTPVASGSPGVGQALIFNGTVYTPTDVSASVKTIHQQYLFTIAGVMSDAGTGEKPIRIYAQDVEAGATITEVFCCLDTAPATDDVRVDVLLNGASIFGAPEYVSIPTGAYTASRTTTFDTDTFDKDDYFQIELVQTDTTASDLTVHVRFDWETT